jgi:periplasmic divalent cation tolerance protein
LAAAWPLPGRCLAAAWPLPGCCLLRHPLCRNSLGSSQPPESAPAPPQPCRAAESLASQLVDAQLAACVNIVPGVTSVYRWQGAVHKDPELLLVVKTRAALLEALTARVRQLHPYDEPEVLALPAAGGSSSYLRWVLDSTAGAQ